MNRLRGTYSLAVGFIGSMALALSACGDSGGNNGFDNDPNNPNGNPDGGGGNPPPPVKCGDNSVDAPASTLDFANNLIASPAPPGNLDPQNAPQIVVFGWDDVESDLGVAFVNELLGTLKNPNGGKAGTNLNPNSCYAQGWADASKYACGNGSLSLVRGEVTKNGFDIANHTVDHLESNSTWTGIPERYKDPTSKSWKSSPDGFGPGVLMDEAGWKDVLGANDTALKALFAGIKIGGFRAPRLEINSAGLQALKTIGYQYDQDLEEILPDGLVDAAIGIDTGAKKGFNWVPWPYTLDNGSPGIWMQQASGDKDFMKTFPSGVWEVPVYQLYVPSKDGLGKKIADTMMAADKSCTFPADVPADQREHCFLSDGELSAGDVVKEVTAFDFNTFVYSRMTPAQWLAVMKHTYLLRYYGNRAPLTYGAHPVEYTEPYDSFTLATQANNYGYRNVLDYSTYTTRKQAMKDFVQWIKSDPELSKNTYFMSAAQLVEYMKAPFDKSGAKVGADSVASPASNGVFTKLGWTGDGATIKVVDGNKADIVFTVTDVNEPVSVGAGFAPGALKGVSHIDIKYSSDVPFRVRLMTKDGSFSTAVLLAGTGERVARIRMKDFGPGPEVTADEAVANNLVNASYLEKVAGISFESAATAITGAKTFNTHIQQMTLHGVATGDLCAK